MATDVWVQLKSWDTRITQCRSCGARIKWSTTPRGKRLPLQASAVIDLHEDRPRVRAESTHWANCPNAKMHKRAKT